MDFKEHVIKRDFGVKVHFQNRFIHVYSCTAKAMPQYGLKIYPTIRAISWRWGLWYITLYFRNVVSP